MRALSRAWLPLYRRLEPGLRTLEAVAAAAHHGFPARQLRLAGVTGTDGKTTTARLVASVLEAGGFRVGLNSTVEFRSGVGERLHEAGLTTPNPRVLQRLLAEMAASGAQWGVLEVTSHGLALRRVATLRFDVAVLTNVSGDHLDFHGSIKRYVESKARLFAGRPGLAVLNRDEPAYPAFDRHAAERKLYYGLDSDADVSASVLDTSSFGARFVLTTPLGARPVRLQLTGRMNVVNALAAAAVGVGLELPLDHVVRGLEETPPLPGRMERVDVGQPFEVVVDHAHTPAALEALFTALRPLTRGRLLALLGADGERDPSKRAPMGEVAASLCDYVIVTENEPGREDPRRIAVDLEVGLRACGKLPGVDYETVPSRRDAIARALALARPGDVVVLPGMGHQRYRRVARGLEPWDDRAVVRELAGSQGASGPNAGSFEPSAEGRRRTSS